MNNVLVAMNQCNDTGSYIHGHSKTIPNECMYQALVPHPESRSSRERR